MTSMNNLLSSPFMVRASSTQHVKIDMKDLEEETEYSNGWSNSSNILLREIYKVLRIEMNNCDQRMKFYKLLNIIFVSLTLTFTAISGILQMTAINKFPNAVYISVTINCLSIVAVSAGKATNADKKASQFAMQIRMLNTLRNEIKLILHT